MLIHVVQRGETLWQISNRYHMNMSRIVNVNRLEYPNRLLIGQALIIPTPDTAARTVIEVNGYLTPMGAEGVSIAGNAGKYLTYLAVFSYKVKTDGTLVPKDDASVLDRTFGMGIIPLMSITNTDGGLFNSDIAHAVLSSDEMQNRLLGNVLTAMLAKGYQGLNIDFEYVYPEDRENYNRFLGKAVTRLHAYGFSVSTALAPKISSTQSGLLYSAHDYHVHGRLADFVIIMTYEWGWVGGKPMAVAPINEVRRVLNYAVTEIPRNKILMGIPLYARDWRLPYVWGVTKAETISLQEAIRRAVRHSVRILYDTVAQTPYYRYTDDQGAVHEVWFEDPRSFRSKYNTAKEYGLRGVSYWELNTEAPQNWPVLESIFRVRKL
jgi:spore germination protein